MARPRKVKEEPQVSALPVLYDHPPAPEPVEGKGEPEGTPTLYPGIRRTDH